MKNYFTLILLLLISSQLSYSQCKDVKHALKAMNNKNIDSAYASLRMAGLLIEENGLESVDQKCLAKYYYANGATHLILGQKEDSLEVKIKWFEKAATSYRRFLALNDKPDDYQEKVNSNLISLGVEFMNTAVDYYQIKNFDLASRYAELGIDLKRSVDPKSIKENDFYTAMLCAKLSNQLSVANGYADSLLMQKKISSAKKEKYGLQKIEILNGLGEVDSALALIRLMESKKVHSAAMQFVKLQIFQLKNQEDSALVLLNEMTKTVKDREDLWVIKGQLHYKQKQIGMSISSFNSAIAINPKNDHALFGLSVLHVNVANENVQLAADTTKKESVQYEEKAVKNFNMAASYLNRILLEQPKRRDVLYALKNIYQSINDQENERLMEDRIKAL